MYELSGCTLFPSIVELNSFRGNWSKYESFLYEIFIKDFVDSKPLLHKKPVNYRRHPEIENKLQSFFHITSVDTSLTTNPNDRIPDLRRCEKIHWVRIIIDAYENKKVCNQCQCGFVKCWAEKWRNNVRWHLLFEEAKFMVVVEEREDYCLLVTSFHLEYSHQIKKKLKKFEQYQKQKTPL